MTWKHQKWYSRHANLFLRWKGASDCTWTIASCHLFITHQAHQQLQTVFSSSPIQYSTRPRPINPENRRRNHYKTIPSPRLPVYRSLFHAIVSIRVLLLLLLQHPHRLFVSLGRIKASRPSLTHIQVLLMQERRLHVLARL
jgi:hypothetical protein